ncbi:MAG TPA: tetratricopeptide repeat protein, partial [Candidatus Goldiibacteriota bacterium]|nr:tetratricopeptide repeat protein [Candidatus Goldiibacteriota bacterium]
PEGVLLRVREQSVVRKVSDIQFRIYSWRGIIGDKAGRDDFTKRLVFDNYAAAYFGFADTLRVSGNFSDSVKMFERGFLFSKNTGALVNQGLAYYYAGDLDGAAAAWQRAIDFEPSNPLPYTNMAYVYISKKDYRTALYYVDAALSRNPEFPAAKRLKSDLESKKPL